MAVGGLECSYSNDLMILFQILENKDLSARDKTRSIIKKYASFAEDKRGDPECVHAALKVTKNYKILCYVPDALLNNDSFMRRLIQEGNDSSIIGYIGEKLLTDEKILKLVNDKYYQKDSRSRFMNVCHIRKIMDDRKGCTYIPFEEILAQIKKDEEGNDAYILDQLAKYNRRMCGTYCFEFTPLARFRMKEIYKATPDRLKKTPEFIVAVLEISRNLRFFKYVPELAQQDVQVQEAIKRLSINTQQEAV